MLLLDKLGIGNKILFINVFVVNLKLIERKYRENI